MRILNIMAILLIMTSCAVKVIPQSGAVNAKEVQRRSFSRF